MTEKPNDRQQQLEELLEFVAMRVVEKAGNDWTFVGAKFPSSAPIIMCEVANFRMKRKIFIGIPEVQSLKKTKRANWREIFSGVIDAQVEQALKDAKKLK